MRASWIVFLLLTGLSPVSNASDADEPTQDNVTAECTVIRMPAELARQFCAEHDLTADAPGVFAALQKLIPAQKAEVAANLKATAKTHERAVSEEGRFKLVVDSVPSSLPGGMLTDILVSCDNHTTTTHSNWKAHSERFFGPYASTWRDESVTYLAYLRLRNGGVETGSRQ